MVSPIFISYRHSNYAEVADLVSIMASRLGRENIFFDQISIRGGDIWKARLGEVEQAKVVVAFIGDGWENSFGRLVANSDMDFVLLELRTALEKHVNIIPVQVGREKLGIDFAGVPDLLRPLSDIQFVWISHANFSQDEAQINNLVERASEEAGVVSVGFPVRYPSLVRREALELEHLRDIEQRIWNWLGGEGEDGASSNCVAVWGLPGIGKSTLADLVASDARVKKMFPDGVLVARFGKGAGDEQAAAVLQNWAVRVNMPAEMRAACSRSDQWRAALQEFVSNRRLLVVIDDVWSAGVARSLLLGGHCAHLVTTRQQAIANDLAGGQVLRLPKLAERQSLRLLKRSAPNAFFEGPGGEAILKQVKRVASELDGLPLALVLIGASLRSIGTEDRLAEIGNRLKYLEDVEHRLSLGSTGNRADDQSLAAVIGPSYDALLSKEPEGESLQRAMRRLCALRPDPKRFSLALARQVTGEQDHTIDILKQFGLLERVSSPTDKTSDEDRYFVIHRTITDCVRRKLHDGEAHQVYQRAVLYYENQLTELEEGFQSMSGQWTSQLRYERPAWQRAMENWRYYLTRLGRYDELALKVMKIWFAAFWWWGCFADFQFCDQLIADWDVEKDHQSTADADVADLRGFQTAYPKETEERVEGERENWRIARQHLEAIGERRKLDGDVNAFDQDQCELRGLMSIFIAESYRFGERNLAAAEEFYRDAVFMFDRPFAECSENWNQPWARYHLADCLYDDGRLDEAEAFAQEGFEMSADGRDLDLEIQALISRLRADIALAENRFDEAVRHLHCAVLAAYRFQIEPLDPDSYTVDFYRVIASRVIASLLNLHERDAASALMVAAGLDSIWNKEHPTSQELREALDRRDAVQLKRILFPPALASMELLKDDGARESFKAEVMDHLDRLRPEDRCTL
ncbi:MAG TPA: NB-ARC domain-containing protein [Paraburkholderia sp.]|uniref:NB-ARC domain-containing protein n=1 Tax=Paraburkholderia sp. TaxID=1926495 RepID=UPI002ED4EFDA